MSLGDTAHLTSCRLLMILFMDFWRHSAAIRPVYMRAIRTNDTPINHLATKNDRLIWRNIIENVSFNTITKINLLKSVKF